VLEGFLRGFGFGHAAGEFSGLDIIQFFIDLLRDPRDFIAQWIKDLGPVWVYTPLFVIIFVETGLVVTPFLPGDSLLFAAGVFAADDGGLNLAPLLVVCYLAAILGNTSNYWIGRKLGQAIIDSGRVKALTPERIAKTQAFFDKYGLLAVVLTRFFPIIRTFAPFLAGVGRMHFGRFSAFNIIGGVLWVTIFTLLGYFFGGVPFIQDNFELVIIAIVVISLIPTAVGIIKTRLGRSK
jgi:membrane-associated protein